MSETPAPTAAVTDDRLRLLDTYRAALGLD